MPIRTEVLVIGGGLAGLSAGIAAAREGAEVIVVSATESTLRQASGLIDVLGYPTRTTGPVSDPFAAISALPDAHPYRLLGPGAIRSGLALFDSILGDTYAGDATDRNALVPTHAGSIKPTARYPTSVAPGLASEERSTLLVGFPTLVDFDAPFVAAKLREAGVPWSVRGATADFPGSYRTDAIVTRLARALEEDEPLRGDGESVRRVLVDRVRAEHDGEERIGLPAILGRDDPRSVRDALREELGADVFEIPLGPPSLLGMRLRDALTESLAASGGRLEVGAPVVDFEERDGLVTEVELDRNGARVSYAADAFVLATGGLIGKGIRSDRDSVTEPVFGCYVAHPADRREWGAERPFGQHAFPQYGVQVRADLRPRDPDGSVRFRNLRAAGSVIGGYDFSAELSGSGVSLTTGTLAGRAAATEGQ